MRIAALQINTTIGDFKGNIRLLTDGYRKAVEQGAEIVVGPELAICGYPPRDLLFYNDFLEATSKAEAFLAKEIGKIPLIVGNVSKRNSGPGKSLWNSAVVIEEGKVSERVHKSLLPTYDVFDEDRYFQPSFESRPIKLRGVRVGITVCEDIWNDPDFWPDRLYKYDPVQNLIEQGVDLLVNVSASPWHIGKERIREDMLCQLAKKVEVPIVQANAIGGNDELVFDGHSIAIDKNGKTQKIAQGFR
ncbi:MAG: nitrilase-related carbon-nitrogen hydrolase, partial [Verrucomicrobiota bacterium]